MVGLLKLMFTTEMTATISPNKIWVHSPKDGRSASVDAPFSCSHLLVSDIDILEEALKDALRQVSRSRFFAFPRVTVSVLGRDSHVIERRAIRDATINAGASDVQFNEIRDCAEDQSAREAYVRERLAAR